MTQHRWFNLTGSKKAADYPPHWSELRGGGYRTIRVAVIGAGKIAKAHLTILNMFPEVNLVGIANRGRVDISGIAHQHRIEAVFDNWRTMITQTKPDAVIILVSPTHTAEVTAELLPMGIPCFIEKPAALSAIEVEKLAELAAKHNCLNMVALNRRYYSTIENGLMAIQQHGPLVGLSVEAHEAFHWIQSRQRHAPEVKNRWLMANTIHVIDLIRRCLGDVVIEAVLRHHIGEKLSGFQVVFSTANGKSGNLYAYWESLPGWKIRMYGTDIRVDYETLETGTITYANATQAPVKIDPVDQQFKPGFYRQLRAFLEAILNDEPMLPPTSDLADHLKTVQFIEKVAGWA